MLRLKRKPVRIVSWMFSTYSSLKAKCCFLSLNLFSDGCWLSRTFIKILNSEAIEQKKLKSVTCVCKSPLPPSFRLSSGLWTVITHEYTLICLNSTCQLVVLLEGELRQTVLFWKLSFFLTPDFSSSDLWRAHWMKSMGSSTWAEAPLEPLAQPFL